MTRSEMPSMLALRSLMSQPQFTNCRFDSSRLILHSHVHRSSYKPPKRRQQVRQFGNRLTESDPGLVGIQNAVVCISEHKTAHHEVVRRKKVGSKNQQVIHKKVPRQNAVKQRNVVKKPVLGEPKMKKANWKQKASKFVFNLLAKTTIVATLSAGMSVAP
jgi:hypothetical protein